MSKPIPIRHNDAECSTPSTYATTTNLAGSMQQSERISKSLPCEQTLYVSPNSKRLVHVFSTTPMTSRPHFMQRKDIGCDDNNNSEHQDDEEEEEEEGNNYHGKHHDRDFIMMSGRRGRSNSLGRWVGGRSHSFGYRGVSESGSGSELLLTPQLVSVETISDHDTTVSQRSTSYMSLISSNSQRQTSESSLLKNNNNDDTDEHFEEKPDRIPASKNSHSICIMYGLINATIVLPVLMSFGSIIYRDNAFAPYQQTLVQLTVFSGIVHQLSFSTFSSLPFAVGQVQDAGLIFLSDMATKMVVHCKAAGHDDETMLATVTIVLACCTAFLGLALIVIGQLRLAQHVQLLPTSVVGGYLAYIGWFCGLSGIGLMAGTSEVSFRVLFANAEGQSTPAILYVIPGVMAGILIYVSVRTLKHMIVLPSCIFILFILFYALLGWTGGSIKEATDNGWIRSMNESGSKGPSWYHTWDYLLNFHLVDWSVVPKLVLTEFSMIFVVALSSSLDVAAIELELEEQERKEQSAENLPAKLPLNYNRELKTVGLSNLISGLTGGYTGSYIFSQSIFSLRAGIQSRLSGYVLALCQVIVMVLPVNILSYVPNFLFGSLLTMICVDLMYEWLWHVRHKVKRAEYVVCLATFVLIQLLGNVEYGIFAGVTLHLLYYNVLLPYVIDVVPSRLPEAELEHVPETESKKRNTNGKTNYGSIGGV